MTPEHLNSILKAFAKVTKLDPEELARSRHRG